MKILPIVLCMLTAFATWAQTPSSNKFTLEEDILLIKKSILADYKGMLKPAEGALKFPYITPGSAQYSKQLWDWDSWLSNVALRQIVLAETDSKTKEKINLIAYEKGCILNYLSYGGWNGWIPTLIGPESGSRDQMMNSGNIFKDNMHKPVLAQHAAFVVQQEDSDASWLRDDFYNLQAFVNCYSNHHYHRATGLYYWQTDRAIGVDNDPATFYRPHGSSGSIYLNCLMYKELKAVSYLAAQLNLPSIAETYAAQAEQLKAAIRKHCWDPKDGLYYSVDLNLLPVEAPKVWWDLHVGGPRNWDCLIQRLGVWSSFLPMWAGIATPQEAERMVKENLLDTASFWAEAGVRTLSKYEKMYDTRATGNPSNWLGPVWMASNYLVFKGLVNYGYAAEARQLAEKSIRMLASDFRRYGALHEYYLPENGEPVLNKGFQNWNYLVMNMISWYETGKAVAEF